jgi:hypothetical protein
MRVLLRSHVWTSEPLQPLMRRAVSGNETCGCAGSRAGRCRIRNQDSAPWRWWFWCTEFGEGRKLWWFKGTCCDTQTHCQVVSPATIEHAILVETFSVRSVRDYTTRTSSSVESYSCQKWEAGSWGRGQFRNPEEQERPPLKNGYQATASEDWEDFMCAVVTVIFEVRNSVRL